MTDAPGTKFGNGTYSVYLYGNETVRLLNAHAAEHAAKQTDDAMQPMYVYLAWNVVHDPNEAPPSYAASNSDIVDTERMYLAAMAQSVDDSIATIVETLKANGMWTNTVLIVHTDNGGNLGGAGNNFPLRGGKYTFWQGGTRGIGFIASPLLPDAVRGLKWNGLAHAVDMHTTIAKLGGASDAMLAATGPLPSDGVDLWPSIIANTSSPREHLVLQVCSGGVCRMWANDKNDSIGAVRKVCWFWLSSTFSSFFR